MKLLLILFITVFGGSVVQGQPDPVLIKINGEEILRSEFEHWYNSKLSCVNSKKQEQVQSPASRSAPEHISTYVDAFVDFKLKVDQARMAGLDTVAAFQEHMAVYRAQLAKNFLTKTNPEDATACRFSKQLVDSVGADKVQVLQVLKKLPQNISSRELNTVEVWMDSLYNALAVSDSVCFMDVVTAFSDDKHSSWITRLEASDEFEKIVFSMQNEEISKPFYTPQGLHIVKVIDRIGMPSNDRSEEIAYPQIEPNKSREGLRALINELKRRYQYSPMQAAIDELFRNCETNRTLFTLAGQSYTGSDFKRFSISYPRSVSIQFDAFVAKSLLDYEHEHLEQNYPDFHSLLRAYSEDELLLQITKQELLDRVVTNPDGLAAYFNSRRSQYRWDTPKFKGAVLHCVDKKSAKQARKLLKKSPKSQWADILQQYFNTPSITKIIMDNGLFAESDNPFIDYLVFKKHASTPPIESYPFTVVVGNKKKGPDTYQEVGERLQMDFFEYCTSLWVNKLRASAKVEINQEVLKTVNNH